MDRRRSPETQYEAMKPFEKPEGTPLEKVELFSRHHNLGGFGEFAIYESTNAAVLANQTLDCNGLIEILITPITNDDTIGCFLGKKFG